MHITPAKSNRYKKAFKQLKKKYLSGEFKCAIGWSDSEAPLAALESKARKESPLRGASAVLARARKSRGERGHKQKRENLKSPKVRQSEKRRMGTKGVREGRRKRRVAKAREIRASGRASSIPRLVIAKYAPRARGYVHRPELDHQSWRESRWPPHYAMPQRRGLGWCISRLGKLSSVIFECCSWGLRKRTG